MGKKKSLYELLEVKMNASAEELKKAFRKMSKKTHPDKGGTNEEFQETKQAYEVLADPKRRRRYDETGEVDEEQQDINRTIHSEIAQVFFATIANAKDKIEHIDIIKEMVKVFSSGIQSAEGIQSELKGKINEYEVLRKRITNKESDENIFDQFINSEIGKINESIDNNNQTVERLNKAKTMLEVYECEYELEEEHDGPMWTTAGQYDKYRRRNKICEEFLNDFT